MITLYPSIRYTFNICLEYIHSLNIFKRLVKFIFKNFLGRIFEFLWTFKIINIRFKRLKILLFERNSNRIKKRFIIIVEKMEYLIIGTNSIELENWQQFFEAKKMRSSEVF